MKKLVANIWNQGSLVSAEISFDQKISQIKTLGSMKLNDPTLLPGFIDLHIHGGGGHDFMEGSSDIDKILKTHAQHGTTSLLATTMTAPHDDLLKAFKALKEFYTNTPKKSSRILGVHLEGPFISPNKLGAQPDFTREATLKEIKELHSIVPIKVITLAPEVFNHLELIGELNKMGIVVQIGHTNGTYEEGVSALNQGAKSFTHLFNAMSTFHHRSPGMVGAALAHAQFAELIPDLEHVHPGAIKAALRSIPQLYFVTDATSATGMPDGDYKLGSNTVHKCLGGVRLKDGTLAGSALTMNQAFRNLLKLGLMEEEASQRLSSIPAQLINDSSIGIIEENRFADFVIYNSNKELIDIFIDGDKV
jgi:N-acetylglucosamine-6-phosphate deacetylase